MSLKIYGVTAEGVEAIRQFMLANHKRPDEATTDAALAKWAEDAVLFADTHGSVVAVIPEEDSVRGEAVGIELEGSCIDVDVLAEFE